MIPVGAVFAVIVILVLLGIVAAARSLKVIQQYEKGIVYRFGQVLPEIRGPGLMPSGRSATGWLRSTCSW